MVTSINTKHSHFGDVTVVDVTLPWRHWVTWLSALLQSVAELFKDTATLTLPCWGRLRMIWSTRVTWRCHVTTVGGLYCSGQVVGDVRNVDVIERYRRWSAGTTDGTYWRNLARRTYRHTHRRTHRQTDRQTEWQTGGRQRHRTVLPKVKLDHYDWQIFRQIRLKVHVKVEKNILKTRTPWKIILKKLARRRLNKRIKRPFTLFIHWSGQAQPICCWFHTLYLRYDTAEVFSHLSLREAPVHNFEHSLIRMLVQINYHPRWPSSQISGNTVLSLTTCWKSRQQTAKRQNNNRRRIRNPITLVVNCDNNNGVSIRVRSSILSSTRTVTVIMVLKVVVNLVEDWQRVKTSE